jgi:hypothetical protein
MTCEFLYNLSGTRWALSMTGNFLFFNIHIIDNIIGQWLDTSYLNYQSKSSYIESPVPKNRINNSNFLVTAHNTTYILSNAYIETIEYCASLWRISNGIT